MVIEEDMEMKKSKKSCLIHYLCVREQLRNKGYVSILMNMVFKREQLKNKIMFAVSDINNNYGVTTT